MNAFRPGIDAQLESAQGQEGGLAPAELPNALAQEFEKTSNQMKFVKQSVMRASPERVFEFHEQPEVLSLLIPPWESARVIQAAKISDVGSKAIVETRVLGPITVRWVAQHTVYDPPRVFEDVQVKGPFKRWRHRHLIEPDKDGAVLRDEIDYDLPLWFLGRALAPILVQKRLQRLFDYRHEVTRRWCEGSLKG